MYPIQGLRGNRECHFGGGDHPVAVSGRLSPGADSFAPLLSGRGFYMPSSILGCLDYLKDEGKIHYEGTSRGGRWVID